MNQPTKFKLLRKILKATGLSDEKVESAVEFIHRLLSDEKSLKSANQFPYRLNPKFLSPAEKAFYTVLQTAVSDWALLQTKVSLGDLFTVTSKEKYRAYRNKIDRKHVDYVLLDPKTLTPMLGIELDDSTHLQAKRMERDEFVEQLFAVAKLPLARVKVQATYSPADIRANLRVVAGLNKESGRQSVAEKVVTAVEATAFEATAFEATAVEPISPQCPACQTPMVKRITKSGTHKGKIFWGCTNYPKCRNVKAV